MTDSPHIQGLTDDENDLLAHLVKQLDDKTPRNLLRSSYYDGKRAIRQVGSVIPPQYYRLGLVLGWSGKAVDLLARRCNFDTMVWPDGDLNSLGYREFADSNFLETELSGAQTLSLTHATSFLINTQGESDEPKSLLHTKDALSGTGDWNPRTRRLDNFLSVHARDDHNKLEQFTLYLDNLTINCALDGGTWTVDRSSHSWGVPVEPLAYKRSPRRPFGMSRISRAIMSAHDSGLRDVIRLEGHMDTYAYPEFWMLGADEGIFKNADGSQKTSWQVMLGRIKGIPDDEEATNPRTDIKQFSASDPTPQLSSLNAHAKLFAREASLPDSALAITDMANPTSADAYDIASDDLIAEAEGAIRRDWAPAIRRANARGLAIQNGLTEIPAEWLTIEAKYRSPRFVSKAAEADAGSKQVASVPWLAETEVGLELLGLDDQQIRRALSERRRNGGSAALRAITEAAAAGRPAVTPNAPVSDG